ncbi:MAG TPA: coproporphyrinogen dehydrogenase HemZ [Clostridiales bacterium]|nr:coproporphyrinogen dehydrogenase HemZ [Clostridiales bacterium]
MYEIDFGHVVNTYELNELVRMFLPPEEYRIKKAGETGDPTAISIAVPVSIADKEDGKRWLYDELARLTGRRLDWGTLTGVRPVKLAGEQVARLGSTEAAREYLLSAYRMTPAKADLLLAIQQLQQSCPPAENSRTVALYVGIPFCPTRCLYCSFPAYALREGQAESYLQALDKEITIIGRLLTEIDCRPDAVYIGGGTPTSLTADQLAGLMKKLAKSFDFSDLREYTVEAGRPDTVTEEKLDVITKEGADRISINPQTLNQKTLDLIGRCHTVEEVVTAFARARKFIELTINMDVIAGLPQETDSDFHNTLKGLLSLRPDNITVHTLAVKRASRLREEDELYSYKTGGEVRQMLDRAGQELTAAGYRPYYLYRQKQTAGNFENIGWSLPGKLSRYNIRTMEEDQTIVALGAGGISKLWYPKPNRLVRVPNVSNYEIYIDRIDEMIERKRKGLSEWQNSIS